MKRYGLVFASMLVLLVFGASLVAAIVSIPPSNPTVEPPGSFLSEEQQFKLGIARDAGAKCEENFRRCKDECLQVYGSTTYKPCYDICLQTRNECYKSLAFFMGEIKPPDIQLPNGGSPGR